MSEPPSPLPSFRKTSPWENIDQALSRLESAILTQQHNTSPDDIQPPLQRLQEQNILLKNTLRQTLSELKTILEI